MKILITIAVLLIVAALLVWLAMGPSLFARFSPSASTDTDISQWKITDPIETKMGSVVGLSHDRGLAFLGLRYAKAPVGDLRFKPPVPADSWDGVFEATRFPNIAMQPDAPPLAREANAGPMSEDSLFLNVYTPSLEGAGRPVLVWIHGGSFTMGSGNGYVGAQLAAQGDVVVVSINYRLGMFGFLDLSAYGEDYAGSASNGIRDQIAALRWVRDNIADYGGDADNVTIFGESAGGTSVASIMAAPEADGLYHKAILHSSVAVHAPPHSQQDSLAQHLKVPPDQLLETLQAMPADEIIAVQQKVRPNFGGIVDGVVVTRSTHQAIAERGAAGVPVIAGSNKDEGTMFTFLAPRFVWGLAGSAVADLTTGGKETDAYLQALKAAYPEDGGADHFERIWTDMFRVGAHKVAKQASEKGAGGWHYRFDMPVQNNPFGITLRATHGSEIGFTFNWFADPDMRPSALYDGHDQAVRQLAEIWSNSIIQFAKTGDPNGAGLPDWPRFEGDGQKTLILDRDPRIDTHTDGNDLARWQKLGLL